MKALKLVSLFLGCRLIWAWFDLCGANLGIGETLPFCLACSGLATTMRLLLFVGAALAMYRLFQIPPIETVIREADLPPGQMYRIHWHRIALVVVILTYPL